MIYESPHDLHGSHIFVSNLADFFPIEREN
jgi:hypothetical protein